MGMKCLIPFLLLPACTPPQAHRPPDPQALHGVRLGVPVPADARPTPGIGCGQLSQDLPLRAHKSLVAAFSDAGAEVSNSDADRWVLNVALREATVGEDNLRPRRTDRPPASPVQPVGPDAPPLDQPQQSIVNGGNGTAVVVLDAQLVRDTTVVWTSTITGHASSAPCVRAIDIVREALGDAVDELRDRVLPILRGR
jgi:hypothetical protein